jgi:hypothetical protein
MDKQALRGGTPLDTSRRLKHAAQALIAHIAEPVQRHASVSLHVNIAHFHDVE